MAEKEVYTGNHYEDSDLIKNARKPEGELGHKILDRMNNSHEEMAKWGVSYFDIKEEDYILDIGCGGGVNVERFAGQISNEGKVIGLDYSDVSVEKSFKRNEEFINEGKVEIIEGSVSEMPFEDKTFDIVTGFETIYFWPDFVNDLKEVNRVLKKGGLVFFCNEVVYKKGEMEKYDDLAKLLDMNIYSEEVLEESLTEAGFGDFETHINEENDWIVILARKN
ncbi:class I SAM-dependent methyltransferase [Methanobrevibacter woesei]|uniref:class I SAM-dependent methyltransferase n=1 Tax=Methanobrevibacter woesei TaxID=190976 RepID=UPI00255B64D2|nr:class I SAM-dependent methyltransferase [Methanobrevibacter woesei]